MKRRAFSFAEVMFAVVILGIGFIMVAAVFPVAIAQTQSTADEAVAARVAHDAMATINKLTKTDDYPVDKGSMHSFSDQSKLWDCIRAQTVDPNNPRYAWVAYYSKADPVGPVRVTVVVARRVIHQQYTAGELQPEGVAITGIQRNSDGIEVVKITKDYTGSYQRVAPGAILLFTGGSDSNISGKAVRLSLLVGETSEYVTYSLAPGEGLERGDYCNTGYASVIGRDFKNPADPSAGYDGPAQDVAAYTTFLNPK